LTGVPEFCPDGVMTTQVSNFDRLTSDDIETGEVALSRSCKMPI